MPDPSLPRAFILAGSLLAVCRAPRYLAELRARGLRALLITSADWRAEADRATGDPDHPLADVEDIAFVAGGVRREGSLLSGPVAAAMTWRERYDIVGAYAVGETMVEPTGLIADALGVPGPGLRASRACRSKYLQRWYLPEFSPRVVIGGEDVSGVRFPAVVKPSGRHSSSGVVTVDDERALAAELARYGEFETVLVEEKIIGPEYSVESLVQHGKAIFASVTRKDTNDSGGRFFVELAHTVPSDHPHVQELLLDANQRVLDALDVRDGITHAEWRVTAEGRPVLMEIAARPPGDGLCSLYELATGKPLEPEVLRIALGEHADYPSPRRYTRQVYLEHPAGVLEDVVVDWPGVTAEWVGEAGVWHQPAPLPGDAPAALRAVHVHQDRGAVLRPLTSSDDRSVTFFIDAPSVDELNAVEARVRAAITIRTKSAVEG
ncbi:ATP-grasp domain-containing protein [Actinokineospora auranticolor]|uniref:ATP-grasp domain-containing protein n=1 Tax=Actinokineospora auranticolor TaxID=155976 RepID=A0A2S6GKE3_9PSEU|nr:ATP-grasp domain-containing protein [Actinokineospora auranticolor]PPK65660.1 ATP-grasp domain-containing protein [Actinokineospora auranticolor]